MFSSKLILILAAVSLSAQAAKPRTKGAFMTALDLQRRDSASGLSVVNDDGATVNLKGLFVRGFRGESSTNCSSGTSLIQGNFLSAALFTPVELADEESSPVGANYLYNLVQATANFGDASQDWTDDATGVNCLTIAATDSVGGVYLSALNNLAEVEDLIVSCNNATLTCTVGASSIVIGGGARRKKR